MDNPDLMRGIKEAQKLSAGDKKANPFEAIVNSAKNIKKEVDKEVEHDELWIYSESYKRQDYPIIHKL